MKKTPVKDKSRRHGGRVTARRHRPAPPQRPAESDPAAGDLEALHSAEFELQVTRDRYARLFEFAPIGYIGLNPRGEIVEANHTAARLLGQPRHWLLKSFFNVRIATQHLSRFLDHMHRCAGSSDAISTEVNLRRPNGSEIPVQLISRRMPADHSPGSIVHQTAIVDLTEGKRVQEAVLLWKETFERSELAIAIVDRECTNFVAVNEAFARMHDATAEELTGAPVARILAPGMERVFPKVARRKQLGRRHAVVELDHIRRGGAIFPVLMDFAPVRNESGRLVCHAMCVQDITERNQAEALLRRAHAELELRVRDRTADLVLINEALKDSEQRIRAIVDTAVDGIITVDGRGTIDSMNPAAIHMFGYQPGEVLGQSVGRLIPAAQTGQNGSSAAGEFFMDKQDSARELTGARKGGARFPLELSVAETAIHGRREFTLFARDLTSHKQAERNRQQQANLLNFSQDAILVLELSGVIVYWNEGAQALYGFTKDEAMGRVIHELLKAGRAPGGDAFLSELQRHGRWSGEVYHTTRDGREVIVESRVQLFQTPEGPRVMEINREITERRRLETELLHIADREQRRIGNDLHDGLGQQLTALEIYNENLAAEYEDKAPGLGEPLRDMGRRLREAIRVARSLARGLSPVGLESEGLMHALRELADTSRALSGVNCDFDFKPGTRVANATVATHLYRIAQEAVNNALKHSGATRVSLSLGGNGSGLELVVRDNGRGIPRSATKQPGMGLRVMKYRADLIGAALEIESAPRTGAQIRCTLRATG